METENRTDGTEVLRYCGFNSADEVRKIVSRLGYAAPAKTIGRTEQHIPDIIRLTKDGLSPSRIAFTLGLDTDRVREVVERHSPKKKTTDSWLGSKRKAP